MVKQQGNIALYTLDMICLILAVTLVFFTVYITPYLVLGYRNYDVPTFVVQLSVWYETHTRLSSSMLVLAIYFPFLMAALAFLGITRIISIYIETHEPEPGVPHVDLDELREHDKMVRHNAWEKFKPVGLVLLLMALVAVVLTAAEYYLVINIL